MDNTISQYFGETSAENGILTEIYSNPLVSENNSDYIIPDYVSDAEHILLCTATPKVKEKFISENELEIEGNICFCLLLATEGNTLSSIVYSEPFQMKANIDGLNDKCYINIIPSMDHVTARLVNPRKVNIKSQVCCNVKVYSESIITPKISGTESLDDDMNMQRHTEDVKTAKIYSSEEIDIHVSHDIELDSGYPQAEEIILCRVEPSPCEVRMRGSEANIRTDMQIYCIYRTEEGNYFCADKKITLEKTIPDLTPDIEWTSRACAGTVDAKIASNAYGERKIIELDFDYDLEMTAVKNIEIKTVCDMYSTEYECQPVFDNIPVTVFKRSYQTNVTVNASVNRSESDSEKVRSVFTGNVFINDKNTEYQKDKNKLITDGTAEITLVCENDALVENEPLFRSVTFKFPFKCEIDAGDDLSDNELSVELAVTDSKFRADSQNLYADFELTVRVSALGKTNLHYLASIELDKEIPVQHSHAPITLCYPSGKETLWDISKYYKITSESIMTANELSSDDISTKKVILIPRNQPKRPIFSKII